MKRLILMRHAKSDWSGGGNDHNRPLNPRGRKAAAALGDWLRAHDLLPDQVLSSSSMRTHETFVRLDLPQDIDVIFTRALYLATHDEILKAMRNASGDTILTLGHNPGSGIAASQILASPPDHPQFQQYPTGATLVADFDIDDWKDADWGKAIARHFVVPRDL
ncbi:histidine phosphatase family protein [Sulfitobacter sp. JBTF-M27]|uniref:Histidine phosphatase family protein n=1 Tax=Sulfitobacter sediminilitoris TaxID=2698830 RepID=A0A6P0CAN5_9RHOB|nr:histidine phosphatase family protein [Sulfitobacter sediminilitoris]NEK22927.1 histidine phosphatase family protein [Sulfitobacter sediminilitoris]